MARFTADELAIRSIQAQRRQANWVGSHPYRECEECFAQIHVGGIYVCQECRDYAANTSITPTRSQSGRRSPRR